MYYLKELVLEGDFDSAESFLAPLEVSDVTFVTYGTE
jgi:hypothetical protein